MVDRNQSFVGCHQVRKTDISSGALTASRESGVDALLFLCVLDPGEPLVNRPRDWDGRQIPQISIARLTAFLLSVPLSASLRDQYIAQVIARKNATAHTLATSARTCTAVYQ